MKLRTFVEFQNVVTVPQGNEWVEKWTRANLFELLPQGPQSQPR